MAIHETLVAARIPMDLPEGRRENFVWHYAWRAGLSLTTALATFGLVGSGCPRHPDRKHPGAPKHALLGTDGLFHPAIGKRLVCTDRFFNRNHPKVASGADPVPLIEVPRAKQCKTERDRWAGGTLVGARLSPIRRRLVEALGPGCATCRNPWAAVVDHDHHSGLVRGYLCRDCNGFVDGCPHLSGCRYADYLGQPPAAGLEITHPDAGRWLKAPKYAGRRRCYETVMNGGVSPGHGLQPSSGRHWVP